MKKEIIAAFLCALMLTGCVAKEPEPVCKENLVPIQSVEHEPKNYVLSGRYELQGRVIVLDAETAGLSK